MWGASTPKSLTPSPPREKQLQNGPSQHAPAGPSVAGSMVANNRAQRRANVPHAPGARSHAGGSPNKAAPAYNPLESPYKTQGQFNSAVSSITKAGYQPELDSLKSEEQEENSLHGVREGDNKSIYEQYSAQASAAFDRAKSAMAEIAARQNASTQAGQQALQAALSNTGVSGLQGPANPSDFMAEAAGFGDKSSQTLAGMQGGEIGERTGDQLVPGAWRQEAMSAEQQRNQGEIAKVQGARAKVLAGIPNAEAKTRGELSKQEQERETAKLQNQLAGGKLGLEKQSQNQKNHIEQQTLAQKGEETHINAALKARELGQAAGFEAEKLGIEREKIAASIKNAKTGEQKVAAELAGKRFDHGLELMSGYLKINAKTEFNPTGVPAQETSLSEGGKKQVYRRNAQQLYDILTKQGNLTAPEAFRLMSSSGNGYIQQFAKEHEAIYNEANHKREQEEKGYNQKQKQFQGLPGPKKGTHNLHGQGVPRGR